MLFAVIPAVAGLLSWLMLGQRPDIGIARRPRRRRGSLLARTRECHASSVSVSHIADGGHHPGQLNRDVGPCRLIDEFGHPACFVLGDPITQLRPRSR